MKLPMPKNLEEYDDNDDEEDEPGGTSTVCNAPAYPNRGGRGGFIPREEDDFGDGGAYPEIHVAQYPRDLGRKGKDGGGKQVALRVGADGKVDFGAIVKQGKNRDMVVFSRYEDMVEKAQVDFERPAEDDEKKTVDKTRAALDALLNGKCERSRPSQAIARPNRDPTFIKYTPSQNSINQNSGAQQRVIRMVEVMADPLEPPKFQRKKIPGQADTDPVPVMHSPPKRVSRADQEAWKIPPCMSNWKNSKGYTRPLDKLVAADGRGIADPQISDNFAKVTEALFIAERVARDEMDHRNRIAQMQSQKKKEHKEADLREMAQKLLDEKTHAVQEETRGGGRDSDEEEEEKDARQRDEIRWERRREMERERRLEAAGKNTKMARDADRDISEKIALGLATKTGGDDMQYDQRLFNQEAGMASGFGEEDNYNIYDKPLLKGSSANMLASHRAKGNDEEMHGGEGAEQEYDKLLKTDRFRPDKGFEGTQDGRKRSRDNPVEFEKDASKEEADPFGLDQFLTDAKKGKKAMDGVQGRRGGMDAAGGGGDGGSSGRDRLEFNK